MANKTSFQPGQSGNPNGRPPKGRALTELLTKAGSKGKRNKLLAELVWRFATTGEVTLPGGKTYKAEDINDLLAAWKWIYQHIDGPAPTSVDVTSGGEKIVGPTIVTLPAISDDSADDGS